jgi:hypothetical protein
MSDTAAAAAAMNIPESLVERSAAARAAATGSTTEQIISAWAGGAPAPTAAPPAPAESAAEPAAAVEPEPQPEPATPRAAEPAPSAAPAAAAAAAPAPVPVAVSAEPPVLRGRTEHPFLLAAGAAALLVVALLVGFLAPALPQEGNGVYSSAVPLTEAALEGRDLYRSEGCSSCHTQVVRPIVADVGLGPVTISDSNQVLGVRRYGPDLAHIGSRVESQSSLLAVLTSSGNHPSYAGLSDTDLENLTAYLFESK